MQPASLKKTGTLKLCQFAKKKLEKYSPKHIFQCKCLFIFTFTYFVAILVRECLRHGRWGWTPLTPLCFAEIHWLQNRRLWIWICMGTFTSTASLVISRTQCTTLRRGSLNNITPPCYIFSPFMNNNDHYSSGHYYSWTSKICRVCENRRVPHLSPIHDADATQLSSSVGSVYCILNSQLAHDDCPRDGFGRQSGNWIYGSSLTIREFWSILATFQQWRHYVVTCHQPQ